MNGIWVLYDQWLQEIKEFYDCEETAWLAYCKWCKIHEEPLIEKLSRTTIHLFQMF